MNQKLSDWASVAEIVSGIAIVVTLVFFVVELRSNTEAIRAQSRQAVSEGVRQVTLVVAENPSLADLASGAVSPEEATVSQRLQLAAWVVAWLTSAQETYLLYEAGILDEELWRVRESQAVNRLIASPTVRGMYEGSRTNYVEGFRNAIDAALVERNDE